MEEEGPCPLTWSLEASRNEPKRQKFSRKRNVERSEPWSGERDAGSWELGTRKRKGTRTDSEQTGAVVPDGILIGSRGSSEKVAKQNKSASRQVGPLFLRYFSLSLSLPLSQTHTHFALSFSLSLSLSPRHGYGARVMHIHVWHSYARN